MKDLTNEQKYLLISMYKEILCRQPVLTSENANNFSDSDEIKERFFPHLSSDYVSDLCWTLESKGYISCAPGDDLANDIKLTDKTIIYMENRFENGLKDVAKFLLNFV